MSQRMLLLCASNLCVKNESRADKIGRWARFKAELDLPSQICPPPQHPLRQGIFRRFQCKYCCQEASHEDRDQQKSNILKSLWPAHYQRFPKPRSPRPPSCTFCPGFVTDIQSYPWSNISQIHLRGSVLDSYSPLPQTWLSWVSPTDVITAGTSRRVNRPSSKPSIQFTEGKMSSALIALTIKPWEDSLNSPNVYPRTTESSLHTSQTGKSTQVNYTLNKVCACISLHAILGSAPGLLGYFSLCDPKVY